MYLHHNCMHHNAVYDTCSAAGGNCHILAATLLNISNKLEKGAIMFKASLIYMYALQFGMSYNTQKCTK